MNRIERVFAYAKEKRGMRYTQYRGLAQVTNWVKLKFATMNLKKTGHLEMETEKSFFPFSNEKACLGVIAKTDFFYRLSGTESLLCAAVCFIHCINPLHTICSFVLSE